jgi:hypothetical protein
VAALVTLLVLSGAGLAASLAGSRVTYRADATLAVVPAATGTSGSNAYQLDVVSRGVIVPTLATVLQAVLAADEVGPAQGRPAVQIQPSDQGGSLLVQVSAATSQDAAAAGTAAVDRAKDEVVALATGYQLSGELGAVRADRPAWRWLAIPGGLAAVGAGLGLVRIRRSRLPY